MNQRFTSLLNSKIEIFRYHFEKLALTLFQKSSEIGLIHPGEFGLQRERHCIDFLKFVVPQNLDFGQGFMINSMDKISTECDIIIYDKFNTPLIQDAKNTKFFPVETISGIVEVKSDLSKENFKLAINKLARNKRLKEQIPHPVGIKNEYKTIFDPKINPYDNIFSVLICNKLNFNFSNIVNEIDSYYDADIEQWQKHNLILSINDGLLAYVDKTDKHCMMYPIIGPEQLRNHIVMPNLNPNYHFYLFSSYIFMGTLSANIYYPDISDYLDIKYNDGIKITQTNLTT